MTFDKTILLDGCIGFGPAAKERTVGLTFQHLSPKDFLLVRTRGYRMVIDRG